MPTEAQALADLRASVLRGEWNAALRHAESGLAANPQSLELRRALAGIHRQNARLADAESLLRDVLVRAPGDFAAAFTLAEMLIEAGRGAAAAETLRTCFAQGAHDAELAIRAVELLDEAGRKHAAASIADAALAGHADDARLHAYAGMLRIQLGEFERARGDFAFALEHDARACDWHVPLGLASAQRYADAKHADFGVFRECLARSDLSDTARTSLLFAAGKAHDDIGDFAQAAGSWREANARAHAATAWSRKNWQRAVESRLASRPQARRLHEPDFVPVFIVGMPRSGTTLAAELLARHPRVRNRGELPWLAKLAQLPALAGNAPRDVLERCAAIYAAQLLQDDAGDTRFFIDKQPLNFRYVDLMLALFPNARIVHCRRDARDTALSLWAQYFHEDVQGYAYDFADMARVMRDSERLMAHWRERYPQAIRELRYEDLAAQPQAQIARLAEWIGVPAGPVSQAQAATDAIGTASLWQARQPVYTRSIGRWRHYAPFVPELEKITAT
ncbi:MAG: sulfotransferase [Proteobacteria bacterium]|nr:sulfotransferase [Pseudomonadota bacterium]